MNFLTPPHCQFAKSFSIWLQILSQVTRKSEKWKEIVVLIEFTYKLVDDLQQTFHLKLLRFKFSSDYVDSTN